MYGIRLIITTVSAHLQFAAIQARAPQALAPRPHWNGR
jgi:hypothetical protein